MTRIVAQRLHLRMRTAAGASWDSQDDAADRSPSLMTLFLMLRPVLHVH